MTLPNMWPSVLIVNRLRQNILSPAVLLKLFRFELGNRSQLIWTSWLGLPKTRRQHDSIWVIVDGMTKSAYFISVKSTYRAKNYAKLYIDDIVRLHGIPLSIILDRGAQFTSHFWRSFLKRLGTQVKLCTTFHPQTD